ncbi:MAG TPA: hypothetical protein VIN02_07845 [Sulfurovum sp.]
MTLDEIEFELEMAGLTREQIVKLLSFCKVHGFDAIVMDKKLQNMGYEPVFSIYDDEDEDQE